MAILISQGVGYIWKLGIRACLSARDSGDKTAASENHSMTGAFEAELNQLHTKYAERAGLIHDKVTPCFEHFISFERAITLAVSEDTALKTLWAGLYKTFEVYTVTTEYTREYTNPIENMYAASKPR
jgi:hypothetical protein